MRIVLGCLLAAVAMAQVPSLEELRSTWQEVRFCRPHAAEGVQPCPAGGNLSTKPWGPQDGTPCEDAGCCVMPNNGPPTAPKCFAPNGGSIGSANQTAYGAFQQAPSISQPGAKLSVDWAGDLLAIDCFTAPPFAGKCGDPGGGLLLPHAGESFGMLRVDGVASSDASTGLVTQWMPHQVSRNATLHRPNGDTITASSVVRMPFNSQVVLIRLLLVGGSDAINVNIDLTALVDVPQKQWGWDVYRPQSLTGFETVVNGTLSQTCSTDGTCSAAAFGTGTSVAPALSRDSATGSLSASWSSLNASEGVEMQLVLSVGRGAEAVSSSTHLIAAGFESAWTAARGDWSSWWQGVFDPTVSNPLPFEGRLPVLHTNETEIKRVYYMNVAALLGNAMYVSSEITTQKGSDWENQTIFVTGGPVCAPSILIIWDTTLNAVLLSMLQPSLFASYFEHWFAKGLHGELAFDAVSNKGIGKWYAFNDVQVFRGIDTLARFVGPSEFVTRVLLSKPVYEWMLETATSWMQLVAPNASDLLADYGLNTNLLECVPTYQHKVASLNAANAWMMKRTATVLKELGNQTEADRLERIATNVSALVRDRLYVAGTAGGYWQCEQPDGSLIPVRHVVDFNTVGASLHDDLSAAQRREMVSFMQRELQTDHWMRALSLSDVSLKTPSENSNRKDHGPLGAYDGWLGETVHTLSLFGEHQAAVEMVRSMAAAYSDGPGGQAHQVFVQQGHELQLPLKAAADQQFFELSGAVTANRIISGLFGVDPPLSTNSSTATPESLLRDPEAPRGFSGVLTGVWLRGKTYTVESTSTGLVIQEE